MTWIVATTSKCRLSPKLTAGIAISALLALGNFVGSASAEQAERERNRGHTDRDYHHNWNGGYYRAPPVVYGSPYGSSYYGSPDYYPPPVIYGPGIGINIRIR
jgi:hypothetical protein